MEKPPKQKRMFVLLEVDTTYTTKELAAAVRSAADGQNVDVLQVQVNVSKPAKSAE